VRKAITALLVNCLLNVIVQNKKVTKVYKIDIHNQYGYVLSFVTYTSCFSIRFDFSYSCHIGYLWVGDV